MLHRFSRFEIDESKRELRVDGRVVAVQPRIFDVLAYLARHRERVVPKEELLEAVWPGVIVTDASLQRAISLARVALGEQGGRAIRTYPRKGYRLNEEGEAGVSAGAKPGVEAARAAYAAGDWETVLKILREVDDLEGLVGEDLQRCAHAAQCVGRPREAIELLERAVAAYTVRGERRAAAWVAVLLAHLRFEWREPILAKGWVHRAERLLEGEGRCRESGYLRFVQARLALVENDAEKGAELADEARRIGVEVGDVDLEAVGLIFVGEAQLIAGNVAEGLAAIDEAAAAVAANNVSSWAGGLVYCGVIFLSMTRADWHRAAEWSGQFTRWCEGRGAAAYPGLCRMHRAEVCAVRGDLAEAEREIRLTLENLAKHAPWAEGDAWMVLGEIAMARGDHAKAREAFVRAHELGWDAQFQLGMLRLAEGEPAEAEALLARAIASDAWACRVHRGRALVHYAIVAARAGHLEKARSALAAIDERPELVSTSAMQALLEQARGELAAAEGRTSEAVKHLRESARRFQAIDAPLAAAQSRCRLAGVLAESGDRESAAMELAAARAVFRGAGAEGMLAQCEAMRAKWREGEIRGPGTGRGRRAVVRGVK